MADSLSQHRELPVPARGRRAWRRPGAPARRGQWGVWLLLVLIAGLLTLAGAGAVATFEYRYANHIYPGVRVAGLPLAGMTVDEAAAAIESALTPYPGVPVTLRYATATWSLSPQDLGVTVDSRATAGLAYSVGREGSTRVAGNKGLFAQWEGLRQDLLAQARTLVFGQAVPVQLRFDEGRVSYLLLRIARDVNQAPQEASLAISDLDVLAVPGQTGRQVDVEATRAALARAAQNGQGGTVSLVVEERQPSISSVEAPAARARALLSQPLTLVAKGADATQRFAVDRAALRRWLQIVPRQVAPGTLGLDVVLNGEAVNAYLKELAGQIDRPVRDATLDFDVAAAAGSQVKVLTPSQAGQQLDVAAARAAIEAALAGDQREIELPIAITAPKVDMNKIAEMGIVEEVSQGSTDFLGSGPERVKNIANAASKFVGVVVPPDGEFSFNKNVGEITAANGFVDALIISGDRTELGVGGGVCQVSTTVFRAAYFGGFPITQRWPHSYVVGWYGKPGLDATIYTPDVDFRFRNDSGHYLLIKPEVDTKAGKITFHFYGTRPNRTVESTGPLISNAKQPGKPVYQEDRTMAPKAVKQVDWAVTGEDVVMIRKVKYGDGSVKEDRFESHYQAWRSVFLYGTGAEIPADADVRPAAPSAPATPTAAPTPKPGG